MTVGSVLIVVFTVLHGVLKSHDDADAVVDGPDNFGTCFFMPGVLIVSGSHSVLHLPAPRCSNSHFWTKLVRSAGLGLVIVVYLLSVTTFRHQWWK